MSKSRVTLKMIKPPAEPEPELTKPIVRSVGNARTLSSKFLGDLQRQYDEKGYKIFDRVLETNPLAYFTALVGLSKIVRVPADVSHRDVPGSRPHACHGCGHALANAGHDTRAIQDWLGHRSI